MHPYSWTPAPPPPPPGRGERWAGLLTIVAAAAAFAVLVATFTGPISTGDVLAQGRLDRVPTPADGPTTPLAPGSLAGAVNAVSVGVVDIDTITRNGAAAGSGMVITSGGFVLTNSHVVEGALRIVVTTVNDGTRYRARLVGDDPDRDVAVLRIDSATGFTPVPLGRSSSVRIGQPIVAIGNAGGTGGTPSVNTGSVMALGQTIVATDSNGARAKQLDGLIQIDADVRPGDSGGPLADAQGRVIGMNTAASVTQRFRFRDGRAPTTDAFAIPIDDALAIAAGLGVVGIVR